MHTLKKVEISLAIGILFALLWGSGTAYAQESLADEMIRLHVVANSDSREDQDNKLAVRDEILKIVAQWGENAESVLEMEAIITANLQELEQAGEKVLRTRGCKHDVSAVITNCYFPTKTYDGFALPAGTYKALRIVIGTGKGENWWCVAFPPLCVGASSKNIEEAAQAGFFSYEQAQFLSGKGENYVLKFRSMELFGHLKNMLFEPET